MNRSLNEEKGTKGTHICFKEFCIGNFYEIKKERRKFNNLKVLEYILRVV